MRPLRDAGIIGKQTGSHSGSLDDVLSHLAVVSELDENMKKAVELYVESCEEEGVEADESICKRSMDIYHCRL